jgi:hypothetical protein
MADPVSAGTIIGGLRVASEAQRLLSDEHKSLRFGFPSSPEGERQCPHLDVFLTSVGTVGATTTRDRLLLPPSHTPLQARDALSKELGITVDQEDIKDGEFQPAAAVGPAARVLLWHPAQCVVCAENGFTLSKEIVALPMWRLSAGCRIHLSFSYRGNVAERGGTGLVQGIKRWTGGGDQEKSQ